MFAPDIYCPSFARCDALGLARVRPYGFADAFHPTDGWTNPDVIGIDVGITLLSAENLRTGAVWRWFMANPEIPRALQAVGVA